MICYPVRISPFLNSLTCSAVEAANAKMLNSVLQAVIALSKLFFHIFGAGGYSIGKFSNESFASQTTVFTSGLLVFFSSCPFLCRYKSHSFLVFAFFSVCMLDKVMLIAESHTGV